jgi:hypothetical protein
MIIPTNDKRFVKDWESTAILNIDDEGYRSFKLDRDRLLQQTKTQNDVAEIRQELDSIKQLLKQLINGNTNGESNI